MENKKNTRIELLLVIAIIVIIVMGVYIYTEKKNSNRTETNVDIEKINNEIMDLKVNVNDLQENINSLVENKESENLDNDINNETVNNNNDNNSNDSSNGTTNETINNNNITTIEEGYYTVDEIRLDGAEVSNEDWGIEIQKYNNFQIYEGYGCYYIGKYEIKDNKLIAESTLYATEAGEYSSEPSDVVFVFDIINDNTLELTNIESNVGGEREVNDLGFEVGMTYSKK